MLYGHEQEWAYSYRKLGQVSFLPCPSLGELELIIRSVIIWRDFKTAAKIEAHEQAVWAVKFVGEDRVVTGKLAVL